MRWFLPEALIGGGGGGGGGKHRFAPSNNFNKVLEKSKYMYVLHQYSQLCLSRICWD